MKRKFARHVLAACAFAWGVFTTTCRAQNLPNVAGCTLYVNGAVGNNGNDGSTPNAATVIPPTGAAHGAFRTVQYAEDWMEKFLSTKSTITAPNQPTTGDYSAPYTIYTINSAQTVCIVKTANPYDSNNIPAGIADAPNPNYPANSYEAYTLEVRVTGTADKHVKFTAYDPTPSNQPTIRQTGYSAIQIDSPSNYIDITYLKLTGRAYEAINHLNAKNTPVALARYDNGVIKPVDWTFYDGGCLLVKGNPVDYTKTQYQHDSTVTDHTKTSPYPVGVPTNIVVDNVTANACGGGGLSTQYADWITFSHNTVYDDAWFGLYGGQGITLEYSVDSERYPTDQHVSNHTLNSTLKNRIIGNYVFDNREYVPWRVQTAIRDGEGIVIDTNSNSPTATTFPVDRYRSQTLIADNAIWNNGSSGIATVGSGWITIANNTLYNNRYYPPGITIPSQDPSSAPYNYAVFPTDIANRPEISLAYTTDPVILQDNIIYGPTPVPGHPCGSSYLAGTPQYNAGSTTYTCIPVSDERISPAADPATNITVYAYMGSNVLFEPGVTLDDPANHMYDPNAKKASIVFGESNTVLNQDPQLVLSHVPVPKSFGLQSDTVIPDFHIRSTSPAVGLYNVYVPNYTYPTDLTDILLNPQPGPTKLLGAYALPE